jgi:hypothetical protein
MKEMKRIVGSDGGLALGNGRRQQRLSGRNPLRTRSKGAKGGKLRGLLGMTANQCEELAANQMDAAYDLNSKKGTTQEGRRANVRVLVFR